VSSRRGGFIVLLAFFACNITACLVRRLSARLQKGAGDFRMGVSSHAHEHAVDPCGRRDPGRRGQQGDLEIQAGQSRAEFLTSRGPVRMPFDVRLVKFDLEYYDNKTVKPRLPREPDTLSIAWPDRHIQTQLVVE